MSSVPESWLNTWDEPLIVSVLSVAMLKSPSLVYCPEVFEKRVSAFMFTSPLLARFAAMVRVPAPGTVLFTLITPKAALVNVPLVTTRLDQ